MYLLDLALLDFFILWTNGPIFRSVPTSQEENGSILKMSRKFIPMFLHVPSPLDSMNFSPVEQNCTFFNF